MNFLDETDHCDDADDIAGVADNCITFDGVALDESVPIGAPVNP